MFRERRNDTCSSARRAESRKYTRKYKSSREKRNPARRERRRAIIVLRPDINYGIDRHSRQTREKMRWDDIRWRSNEKRINSQSKDQRRGRATSSRQTHGMFIVVVVVVAVMKISDDVGARVLTVIQLRNFEWNGDLPKDTVGKDTHSSMWMETKVEDKKNGHSPSWERFAGRWHKAENSFGLEIDACCYYSYVAMNGNPYGNETMCLT